MKRSVGVTAAAIVVFLYGIAFLIGGVNMFGLVFRLHPGQSMRMFRAIALPALRLAAMEVGVFATSWGIFRLRRWARWSVLSMGAGMVGVGAYLWIGVYLTFPQHGLTSRGVGFDSPLSIALGSMLILVIPGAWWLVLFTRPSIEAQFKGSVRTSESVVSSNGVSASQ